MSDSDSFGEASQPAAKRPARRSAKGTSGATKKRKKVVHEEAIEDNAPEEELERGARKKNRNRVEVSDDEKQGYVKVRATVLFDLFFFK